MDKIKQNVICDFATKFVKTNKTITITFNEYGFGEPITLDVWECKNTNGKFVCVHEFARYDFYKIIPKMFHDVTHVQMVEYYLTINDWDLK